jgi:hypothetical protein
VLGFWKCVSHATGRFTQLENTSALWKIIKKESGNYQKISLKMGFMIVTNPQYISHKCNDSVVDRMLK